MEAQVEMQLEQFKAELEARTETMIEQISQRFEAWKVDREHEHHVELEHIKGGGEHLAKIADAISRPKRIHRDETGNITGIGHHHLLRAVCR